MYEYGKSNFYGMIPDMSIKEKENGKGQEISRTDYFNGG